MPFGDGGVAIEGAVTSAALQPVVDRRDQDVAGAAHRLDDLRVVDVRLELLAQAADLDVDRAVERAGLAAARLLEQEVARQHAAGMLDERRQQAELAAS